MEYIQDILKGISDTEKVVKCVINHIQEINNELTDNQNKKTVIEYYWKPSEVSYNKTELDEVAINSSRVDAIDTTIYNVYNLVDDTIIGEIASFYTKIPSLKIPNLYYYDIESFINIFDVIQVDGVSAGATFDKNTNKFSFSTGIRKYKDFAGNKVTIEKLQDDPSNLNKAKYRLTQYSKSC